MPNWVDNDIVISTNNPLLIDLLMQIKNSDDKRGFSDDDISVFEVLNPIGESDTEIAVEAWGCKWDIQHFSIMNASWKTTEEFLLNFQGQTPWSFPDNLLEHLQKTFTTDEFFVKVKCVWLEEGGEWGEWENGVYVANGELCKKDLTDETYAYNLLQEKFDIDTQWDWLRDEEEDE